MRWFYREAGQFKTSYAADMAIFPIRQDRIGLALILLVAFVIIPLAGESIPAQLGADPVSDLFARRDRPQHPHRLHRAAVAGIGGVHGGRGVCLLQAVDLLPRVNILVWIVASGFVSSAVGVFFGLPSLRIKGFYLAVATLAAQFFLQWCFARVPWLYNDNTSGAIEVGTHTLAGVPVTGPNAAPATRYLIVLTSSPRWPGSPRTSCTGASGGCGWRCGTWTSPPS